jgi:hypothetical protein
MWSGSSKLHLSWLPEDQKVQESESELTISVEPRASYAIVSYTWIYEGETQHGTMLVAGDIEAGTGSIGWSDSWHQSSGVMHLDGTFSETSIACLGTYGGEGDEAYGWRVTLEMNGDDQFVVKMTNIEPNGNEEWAVEAVYSRA